jgi:UDP-GlcNAc:undecaprenyl-phosphate GlcNAc-1-phosphate transferase
VRVLVIAAAMSALLQWPALGVLRALAIVDNPNHRSSHLMPTLRGGGLAVLIAWLLALLLSPIPLSLLIIALAVAAFGLLGWGDDRGELGVGRRLASQFAVSLSACIALCLANGLTFLSWTSAPVVLAVIAVVAYVNAFNFMDGVNGISAMNAGITGAFFMWLGGTHSQPGILAAGAAIAGVSVGFLPWNAPHAKVFLGDVGSYTLGSAVILLVVWSAAAGIPIFYSIAPVLVYFVDTGWTLMRRLLGHRVWREAHREHVYQRFTDCGFSHIASAALVATLSGTICLSAILMIPVNLPWLWASSCSAYTWQLPSCLNLSRRVNEPGFHWEGSSDDRSPGWRGRPAPRSGEAVATRTCSPPTMAETWPEADQV